MLKYMLRRILQMIPVLLIITIITFLFVNASGDPTSMLLPPEATQEDREVMRAALGLDKPIRSNMRFSCAMRCRANLERACAMVWKR